jgi:adenylate kinase
MAKGGLVADSVMVALIEEQLQIRREPCALLFDGFPRTISEATALDRALGAVGRRVTAVVLLRVPDDVIVERVGGPSGSTERRCLRATMIAPR